MLRPDFSFKQKNEALQKTRIIGVHIRKARVSEKKNVFGSCFFGPVRVGLRPTVTAKRRTKLCSTGIYVNFRGRKDTQKFPGSHFLAAVFAHTKKQRLAELWSSIFSFSAFHVSSRLIHPIFESKPACVIPSGFARH